MGNWLEDYEEQEKKRKAEEQRRNAEWSQKSKIAQEKNRSIFAELEVLTAPIFAQFKPHVERANKNGFFITSFPVKGQPGISLYRPDKRYQGTEPEMSATKSVDIYATEKGFSIFFKKGDIRLRWHGTFRKYEAHCHRPSLSEHIDKIPFTSIQDAEILEILKWLAMETGYLPHFRGGRKQRYGILSIFN